MDKKKTKLNNILDSLLDKDGLKTEVTITLTNQTLFKVIFALLMSGFSIVLVSNIVKNLFPNKRLVGIEKEVLKISNNLINN